jgi:leucyl aminopeptidase
MVTVTLPQLRLGATLLSGDAVRVVGVSGDNTHRHLHAHPELQHLAEVLPVVLPGVATDSFTRIADPHDASRAIVFIGLGSGVTTETLRLAGGAAVRKLSGSDRVNFAFGLDDVDQVTALAEGALLGAYTFTAYKADTSKITSAVSNVHITTAAKIGRKTLDALRTSAEAVSLVKDLVNTPANDLYPETLVERVRGAVAGLPITVTIWDEKKLARDGFGGILGVGKGSTRPPRLMKLSYRPEGAKTHLSLAGKGITFDTGGLSLKTPTGMVGMKYDMTGAATVAGVIRAIAQNGWNVRVTAWLAIAENMPSGHATRPNDVLTMHGGTTVEVLNTDAEGRLVLADALVAASAEHPDLLIDVATLTGAATVALGTRHTGAMGSVDEISRLVEVARERGENIWPMPIPEESRALLASDIADIANAKPGNTAGGMLVGAAFLREFVGTSSPGDGATRLPWIHLDIASTANNSGGAFGFTGSGPTGTTVRSLISFAEGLARK